MTATRKLTTKPPRKSAAPADDRAALRAAVAEEAAARSALRSVQAAEQRAADLVTAAETEVDEAETAVEAAKAASLRALTTAVKAGKKAPASPVAAARARFTAALDQLDAAKETLAAIQAETNPAHARLATAKTMTEAHAGVILRPAADRLLGAIEALRVELARKRSLLMFAQRHGAFRDPVPVGERFVSNVRTEAEWRAQVVVDQALSGHGLDWDAIEGEAKAAVAAVLTALEADPGAEVSL